MYDLKRDFQNTEDACLFKAVPQSLGCGIVIVTDPQKLLQDSFLSITAHSTFCTMRSNNILHKCQSLIISKHHIN